MEVTSALLPVIVGGLSGAVVALAGSLATTAMTTRAAHARLETERRDKLRQQTYLELVAKVEEVVTGMSSLPMREKPLEHHSQVMAAASGAFAKAQLVASPETAALIAKTLMDAALAWKPLAPILVRHKEAEREESLSLLVTLREFTDVLTVQLPELLKSVVAMRVGLRRDLGLPDNERYGELMLAQYQDNQRLGLAMLERLWKPRTP